MTDEAKALVERLRWGEWYFEDPFDGKAYASDDPLDAADLIETQELEIEELRSALERIIKLSPAVTHGWAEETRQIARTALAARGLEIREVQ